MLSPLPEPLPNTIPVSELVAMSDDELGQFMKQNRDETGAYHLPVDGWNNLSRDELGRLAERLKAQERVLAQDPAPASVPFDPGELDARLRQLQPNNETQPPQAAREPSPATYSRALDKKYETAFYHDLVSDGGRPLYPIELIDDVLKNPDKHRKMLQPLQKLPEANEPSHVFQDQRQKWKDFQKWQKDNRGLEDENDSYAAHVKFRMRWSEFSATEDAHAELLVNMDKDPSHLKPEWERQQRQRRWERSWRREDDCNGFVEYHEAVKRRLASHKFTRAFELKEDLTQQDKLTTWIEYLGFEYWWLDKHARDIQRLALERDEGWQKLVDSKLVGPGDTPESIRSDRTGLQHDREEQSARTDVQMAKAEGERVYKLTQESQQRLQIPKEDRIAMLDRATQDIVAAEWRYEELKARHNKVMAFVRDTFKYHDTQRMSACQSLLVQWVLEQVPLVEAEMAQAEKFLGKGKKRMLSESPGSPGHKRQNVGEASLQSRGEPAQVTTQTAQEVNGSGTVEPKSADTSSVPSAGLRRSARIAARQPPVQPEPRQLHPRAAKKAAKQSKPKGTKDAKVGKKKGTKTKSRKSRR